MECILLGSVAVCLLSRFERRTSVIQFDGSHPPPQNSPQCIYVSCGISANIFRQNSPKRCYTFSVTNFVICLAMKHALWSFYTRDIFVAFNFASFFQLIFIFAFENYINRQFSTPVIHCFCTCKLKAIRASCHCGMIDSLFSSDFRGCSLAVILSRSCAYN